MASSLEQQLSDKIAEMSETISALRAQAGMEKSFREVAEQQLSTSQARVQMLEARVDEFETSRNLNNASDKLADAKTSSRNPYSLAGSSAAKAGKESTQKEESGPTSTPEYN